MASELIKKIFLRFPNILGDVYDIAVEILSREREQTRQYIAAVVEAELSYIFTNDWDYMMKSQSYVKKDENTNSIFVKEIRQRLDNYYAIVIRNIRDTVPKIIGYHLIKKTEENFNYAMWNAINYEKNDIFNKLIEPDSIALERESVSKQLKILQGAYKIIKKDPNLSRLLSQANAESGERRRTEASNKKEPVKKVDKVDTHNNTNITTDNSVKDVNINKDQQPVKTNKKLILFKKDNNE